MMLLAVRNHRLCLPAKASLRARTARHDAVRMHTSQAAYTQAAPPATHSAVGGKRAGYSPRTA